MCKRIILNLSLLSVDDLIKAALFCYMPLCWPSFKSQFDKCVASAQPIEDCLQFLNLSFYLTSVPISDIPLKTAHIAKGCQKKT